MVDISDNLVIHSKWGPKIIKDTKANQTSGRKFIGLSFERYNG
jgi:hypothetical protein